MNADTRSKWIAKYKVMLEANKLTTEEAFAMTDTNKSGSIDLEELKEVLKSAIPIHKLSYNDIVQILNAFDTNGDGIIDEQEYYAQVEHSVQLFEDKFEEVDFGDQAFITPKPQNLGTSSYLPTKENLQKKEIASISTLNANEKIDDRSKMLEFISLL